MAQEQMQPEQPANATSGAAQGTQPASETSNVSEQPSEGKKMQWWIWLIIALVVVGAGVGIYFWLM